MTSTHGNAADTRLQPGEIVEFCRLVARILRRRTGDGDLAQEADARAALTEYAKEEIETSEGPQ